MGETQDIDIQLVRMGTGILKVFECMDIYDVILSYMQLITTI